MKTVSFKISEELHATVRRRLDENGESFSDLVRRALEREAATAEVDFVELAAPYNGMFDGPEDLSSREGYAHSPDR